MNFLKGVIKFQRFIKLLALKSWLVATLENNFENESHTKTSHFMKQMSTQILWHITWCDKNGMSRCVRHLYKPLLSRGYTTFKASFLVFLVSALLHEYLVSVPLRMFKYYAFLGMLLQVNFLFNKHIVQGPDLNCDILYTQKLGKLPTFSPIFSIQHLC